MNVFDLVYLASVLNAFVISLVFMASKILSNPRLSAWAKTEIVQLFVSVIFVLLCLNVIDSLKYIKLSDIAFLVDKSVNKDIDVFSAAMNYLIDSSNFAHNSAIYSLQSLGQIDVLRSYSKWKCPIWCFMSSGGTGSVIAPYVGYSYISSLFSFTMSSSLSSYLSALVNLQFFIYIKTGLFMFFFPLGIIFRNLPFLRKLGAVFISVVFSFYIIYPFLLSTFYIILPIEIPKVSLEFHIPSSGGWLSGSVGMADNLNSLSKAVKLASLSFFYSIFIPNIALIAAIASTVYVSGMMGEEINLSRIISMV